MEKGEGGNSHYNIKKIKNCNKNTNDAAMNRKKTRKKKTEKSLKK